METISDPFTQGRFLFSSILSTLDRDLDIEMISKTAKSWLFFCCVFWFRDLLYHDDTGEVVIYRAKEAHNEHNHFVIPVMYYTQVAD